MRAKVWKGRTETTLFCCKTYAGDLERLFKLMWDKFARGDKPGHITELASEETKRDIKITEIEKMTIETNGTNNYQKNKESSRIERVTV